MSATLTGCLHYECYLAVIGGYGLNRYCLNHAPNNHPTPVRTELLAQLAAQVAAGILANANAHPLEAAASKRAVTEMSVALAESILAKAERRTKESDRNG